MIRRATTPMTGQHFILTVMVLGSGVAFVLLSLTTGVLASLYGPSVARHYSEQLYREQRIASPHPSAVLDKGFSVFNPVKPVLTKRFHRWFDQRLMRQGWLDNTASSPLMAMLMLLVTMGGQLFNTLALRFIQLVLSLPLLFLLLGVGWVDGLVQRHCRRYRGERESAYRFHRTKRLCQQVWGVGWIGYLASPVVIPLSGMLLIVYPILAYLTAKTNRYFKKYT